MSGSQGVSGRKRESEGCDEALDQARKVGRREAVRKNG